MLPALTGSKAFHCSSVQILQLSDEQYSAHGMNFSVVGLPILSQNLFLSVPAMCVQTEYSPLRKKKHKKLHISWGDSQMVDKFLHRSGVVYVSVQGLMGSPMCRQVVVVYERSCSCCTGGEKSRLPWQNLTTTHPTTILVTQPKKKKKKR